MAINDDGIRLVKFYEGLYLRAYLDPVGVLTIGYGHTGPGVFDGQVITEQEAERLLVDDLSQHEAFVDSVVQAPINDNQRAALVSFAFNVGNGSLRDSTLLRKLNTSDYEGASNEFTRWVYGTVNGVKTILPGLVKRRNSERSLFRGEAFQLGNVKMTISTDADEAPAGAGNGGSSGGSGGSAGAGDDYDAGFSAHIQALGLKNFKPYEFLVMGNQHSNPQSAAFGLNRKPPRELWVNIDATARVIDRLRDVMGAPIATLSVYRSPAYNKAIAGAGASQHMEFKAIDFVVKSNSGPADWAGALRQLRSEGLFKGGIGTYASFVHVDTRGQNVDW